MKHKFFLLISLITVTAVLLVGCSDAVAATVTSNGGLSTAARLAVGTLKLEGSNQAVTATQASQLLTLWEGYQSMSNSDTNSQVELEALVAQIQGEMTASQVQAIEAMGLTDKSVSEVVQSLGNSANTTTLAITPGAATSNQPGLGGGPGGMPGGGGDSVMSAINGGTTTQSTPATTQAATNAQTNLINPVVIRALIQLLETRSQASG
jgi:hypothetical protein